MSSPRSPKDNSLVDAINPYMAELRMHPKELSLKDEKVQIEDVRGPKGKGSVTPQNFLNKEKHFSNYSKIGANKIFRF